MTAPDPATRRNALAAAPHPGGPQLAAAGHAPPP
ncbi:Uncharacterised protein [Bordetella trematum]|nr:Uncharacterised protein [Bordetella trematum]VDH07479.1 Uncharacterised protein [Bordetella trematum]